MPAPCSRSRAIRPCSGEADRARAASRRCWRGPAPVDRRVADRQHPHGLHQREREIERHGDDGRIGDRGAGPRLEGSEVSRELGRREQLLEALLCHDRCLGERRVDLDLVVVLDVSVHRLGSVHLDAQPDMAVRDPQGVAPAGREPRGRDLLVRVDRGRGRLVAQLVLVGDGPSDEGVVRHVHGPEVSRVDQRVERGVGRDILVGHDDRRRVCTRAVLDAIRIDDHANGRQDREHDSDRNHQTS